MVVGQGEGTAWERGHDPRQHPVVES